jgi:hypothetical protein
MYNKKLISATLITTAALAFTAAPITSALAEGMSADVKCFGTNACKGQGACKTTQNNCKAQNNCKGKGFTMMASDKLCTEAGGKLTESAA